MRKIILLVMAVVFLANACSSPTRDVQPAKAQDLWQVYYDALKTAKYVDLTHTIAPVDPGLERLWGIESSARPSIQRPARHTPTRKMDLRRRTTTSRPTSWVRSSIRPRIGRPNIRR